MASSKRGDALAIDELLARDEENFVRGAYRALLGREPDPEGLGNYLEELLDGVPKINLLAAMASSREGRARAGSLGDAVLSAFEEQRSIAAPTAACLDDLLGCHDERFVRCAYLTILGREADADGVIYYVRLLRAGSSKLGILASLRASSESRARAAELDRMECAAAGAAEAARRARVLRGAIDAALRRYRWARVPIVGPALGFLLGVESDGATQRRLRRIENQLFLLGAASRDRFAVSRGEAPASPAPGVEPAGTRSARAEVLKPSASVAPMLCTLPAPFDAEGAREGSA